MLNNKVHEPQVTRDHNKGVSYPQVEEQEDRPTTKSQQVTLQAIDASKNLNKAQKEKEATDITIKEIRKTYDAIERLSPEDLKNPVKLAGLSVATSYLEGKDLGKKENMQALLTKVTKRKEIKKELGKYASIDEMPEALIEEATKLALDPSEHTNFFLSALKGVGQTVNSFAEGFMGNMEDGGGRRATQMYTKAMVDTGRANPQGRYGGVWAGEQGRVEQEARDKEQSRYDEELKYRSERDEVQDQFTQAGIDIQESIARLKEETLEFDKGKWGVEQRVQAFTILSNLALNIEKLAADNPLFDSAGAWERQMNVLSEIGLDIKSFASLGDQFYIKTGQENSWVDTSGNVVTQKSLSDKVSKDISNLRLEKENTSDEYRKKDIDRKIQKLSLTQRELRLDELEEKIIGTSGTEKSEIQSEINTLKRRIAKDRRVENFYDRLAEKKEKQQSLKDVPIDDYFKTLGKDSLNMFKKAVDGIKRPKKAVFNAMLSGLNAMKGDAEFAPIASAIEGFTSDETIAFVDILDKTGWEPEGRIGKISKGVVAAAGETMLDPVNWFIGALATSIKAPKAAIDTVYGVRLLVAGKKGQRFYEVNGTIVDANGNYIYEMPASGLQPQKLLPGKQQGLLAERATAPSGQFNMPQSNIFQPQKLLPGGGESKLLPEVSQTYLNNFNKLSINKNGHIVAPAGVPKVSSQKLLTEGNQLSQGDLVEIFQLPGGKELYSVGRGSFARPGGFMSSSKQSLKTKPVKPSEFVKYEKDFKLWKKSGKWTGTSKDFQNRMQGYIMPPKNISKAQKLFNDWIEKMLNN
jgi:hypothetical protein